MRKKKQVMLAMGCVIKNDSVLLVQRDDPAVPLLHGGWELPGGRIEFGEAAARTCEREVFEEGGVIVVAGDMLPFSYSAVRRLKHHDLHVTIVCFRCRYVSSQSLDVQDNKVAAVRWCKLSTLDRHVVQEGSFRFLLHVANNQDGFSA